MNNLLLVTSIWVGYITAVRAATGQCSIPPLWLPWSNVTVSADGLAVSRGVELGIGTPVQIFSLRPATTLNNTRIYNVLDCVSAANTSCVGGTGGVFDSSKSSTYVVAIKSQWNGSEADTETATGSFVYFNDWLNFERNGSVAGFPLVMDTELNKASQNGLPLGLSSSFLSAVTKSLIAPTSAWGLWSGSRSLAPVDGALVIGGYDSARVANNFTTFPIGTWTSSQPCPLQVSVAHITYNLPDGSNTDLFRNSSVPMNTCVEPVQQRFTFTPDVAIRFANITGYNSSYPGLTYPVTAIPSGNLTITLSNNYSTTIPNYELFTLLRGSDQYGRYAITNSSIVETGMAYNVASNPASVLPVLGGLFLTFNYLVVDYEAGIFQLAPAIGGEMDDSARQLTSICTQKAPTSSPSATKTSAPTTSATIPTGNTGPSTKVRTGAIAGGVIGSVAGLVLIAAALFFFMRHYRAVSKAKETPLQHESGMLNRRTLRVMSTELPTPIPVHEMPVEEREDGVPFPAPY